MAGDIGSTDLTREQQQQLVYAIAQALPGDWASGPDHELRETWEITSSDLRIHITLGRTHLVAHGLFPIPARHCASDFDLQRISVRIALTKPVDRIAADLERRLLPSVRGDNDRLQKALWRAELRTSKRLAILRRARAVLGEGLTWQTHSFTGQSPTYDRASAYDLAGLHLSIELTGDRTRGEHASLSISQLTNDELLTLIRSAADLVKTREAESTEDFAPPDSGSVSGSGR